MNPSMAYVEQIRAAYQAAIAPLVREQAEALKRCRNRDEISRCIEAFGKLHRVMEDQVRQQHGLPPVQWWRGSE